MISILSVMLMVRLLAWNLECFNLKKLLDRIHSRKNEENVLQKNNLHLVGKSYLDDVRGWEQFHWRNSPMEIHCTINIALNACRDFFKKVFQMLFVFELIDEYNLINSL